jgi:Flp pilus assembly CpaE family ATPase
MTGDCSVIGACGGAGASTVAVALALASDVPGRHPLLVDLDPRCGDLAGGLGSPARRGVADLAAVAAELTGDHLRAAVTPHPAGLAIVAGTPTPESGGLARLLTALLALDDRAPLVLDLGAGAGPLTGLAAAAGPVILVAPCDLAGCRVARRTAAALAHHGAEIVLAVNRGARRAEMSAAQVARALGLARAVEVPAAAHEAADLLAGLPRRGRRARLPAAGRALAEAAGLMPAGRAGIGEGAR